MTHVLANKCRVCGCSELVPCVMLDVRGRQTTCGWLDIDHSLCSNWRCIAMIPITELEKMDIIVRTR